MKTVAFLLLFAFASSAPEARYFRYQRTVQTTAAGQTCVALSPDIFVHAEAELADLRLYRNGIETPYTIRTAAATESQEQNIVAMNRGRQGEAIVFDATMHGVTYSDLQLNVTQENFIATVTVAGSELQADSAVTQLGTYTIFDLTKQRLGRSTVLHLPQANFAFLHFSVSGLAAPENVTGLTIQRVPVQTARYQAVAQTRQALQKEHDSVYTLTLPARMPVDRIVFTPGPGSGSGNFSRAVTVTVTGDKPKNDDGPAPEYSSSDNLLRLHSKQGGRAIDEEHLAIRPPSTGMLGGTNAHWTITVHNEDDAPVPFATITLETLERSLCFDSMGPGSSTLMYGDDTLALPSYDYARLFAAAEHPALAALEPETPNPAYETRPDDRPFTERHPVLLWAALIIVLLVLALVAFRSAKATPAL